MSVMIFSHISSVPLCRKRSQWMRRLISSLTVLPRVQTDPADEDDIDQSRRVGTDARDEQSDDQSADGDKSSQSAVG